MVQYSQRIAATRSLSDAPLGTIQLPGRIAPDPLSDALLAALPAGSLWLDPAKGYSASDKTWTDRKSGRVLRLGTYANAAMPTLTPAMQNGQPSLLFGGASALVSDQGDVWPVGDNSYSMVTLFKQTADNGNGGFCCNQRVDASETGGVITGKSMMRWQAAGSVLSWYHQTKSGTTSLGSIAQTITAAAAGTAAQMWVYAFDAAANTACMRKNGEWVRNFSNVTRRVQEGHLVVGASGYVPGTVEQLLTNTHVLGHLLVPGLALNRTGTGNEQHVAVLAAIDAYAQGRLAVW